MCSFVSLLPDLQFAEKEWIQSVVIFSSVFAPEEAVTIFVIFSVNLQSQPRKSRRQSRTNSSKKKDNNETMSEWMSWSLSDTKKLKIILTLTRTVQDRTPNWVHSTPNSGEPRGTFEGAHNRQLALHSTLYCCKRSVGAGYSTQRAAQYSDSAVRGKRDANTVRKRACCWKRSFSR